MINVLQLVGFLVEEMKGTSNTTYHVSFVRVVNILLMAGLSSLKLGSNNLDRRFTPFIIPPGRLEVFELMARMKNYHSR